MYSIEFLQNKINEEIAKQNFNLEPKLLYEPINYTLSIGGKRLRPLLVLLACDMFDGNLSYAISPAIGIEIFHNFTLIHDDIMDKAPLRRNMPTVYKKWNANIAILSGDVMFAKAYDYMLLTNPKALLNVIKTLNYVAIKVCEGQQYDMDFETDNNVTINDYIKMIRLKTGILLAASLKIGSLIADASEKNVNLMFNFGENIGIAFQIQDDFLDVYANNIKFGKSLGGDIVTNKKTYLFLKSYQLADKNTKLKLDKLFNDKNINPEDKIKNVTDIYNSLNIKQYCINEMNNYFEKGLQYLNMIEIEEDKKYNLKKFINELIKRNY
jgi:geranylgeranyl diphosphate synthase type II